MSNWVSSPRAGNWEGEHFHHAERVEKILDSFVPPLQASNFTVRRQQCLAF